MTAIFSKPAVCWTFLYLGFLYRQNVWKVMFDGVKYCTQDTFLRAFTLIYPIFGINLFSIFFIVFQFQFN